MSVAVRARMTADEFLAWASEQPEARHYELVDGEIVTVSPERRGHVAAKYEAWLALRQAIAAAGVPCELLGDGIAVQIDETTVYEPDAVVRLGPPLPDDALKLSDPLIVVEVASPTSLRRDEREKLKNYFRLPSLRHYLLVRPEERSVTHYERDEQGNIHRRLAHHGPGVRVEVGGLFSRSP